MDSDIKSISGIGKNRAELLNKLNINTVGELLYFLPRSYEDRSRLVNISDVTADETVCIKATVASGVRENRVRKNLSVLTMRVQDTSGMMNIVWYNNRFVKNAFKLGEEYIMFGKISKGRLGFEMVNPVYEKCGNDKYTGKIVPIYPMTKGLNQKVLQSAISSALESVKVIPECIPEKIRHQYNICEVNYAIKNIHFPDNFNDYTIARKRLVFEELFVLQSALLMKRTERTVNDGAVFDIKCTREFTDSLPFEFTGAQKRTINEISKDVSSGRQMCRLVQGDVGSGKTAVAATAMFQAVKSGYQAVLMAPTEILATQHYESLKKQFEPFGIRVRLLTGGLGAKEKRLVKEEAALGTADIIIGTNAVIQDDVSFNNVGLVIVDEQHRFGVEQRGRLLSKSNNPHMLVMSATPIPRTLALILYGDLKISVIDELPPGRKEVKTYAVGENMRQRINGFIEKNLTEGGQCYVVCPLVEETESSDLKDATNMCEKLRATFPSYTVGLMHGKMKPAAKDEIMREFSEKKIDILVSTTVIEVGINVPNSNLMIIENAERFGLSQLHQLRGRVGRGERQSWCVLIAKSANKLTKQRMETMCMSNDGFYISEQDLKLRGPGDFFGTRQHGLPELKVANLFEDADILRLAQKAAENLLEEDPTLSDYPVLRGRIEKIYTEAGELN